MPTRATRVSRRRVRPRVRLPIAMAASEQRDRQTRAARSLCSAIGVGAALLVRAGRGRQRRVCSNARRQNSICVSRNPDAAAMVSE